MGRTLAIVKAQHDENVFGKVGTSAAEIEKALTGKKIVGAGQQGKYFWYVKNRLGLDFVDCLEIVKDNDGFTTTSSVSFWHGRLVPYT